jgi:uncharacterized protein
MRKMTLITGASSGLGKDYATQYAARKEDLIIVARRLDRLLSLQEELQKEYGISVLVYQVDLSDLKQTQDFLNQLPKDIFIHRLINNAGFGFHGAFEDYSEETVGSMIMVNVLALSHLTHYFIPQMKENHEGEILNVASMAAYTPGPFMAEYYATKAYVLSFSMALHEELKPHGIKVSAVCPGPTKTEFGTAAHYAHQDGIESTFSMSSLPVVIMSMKALDRNKSVAIPGFSNKVLHLLMKFLPRRLGAKVVMRIQKQRF